MPAKLGIAVPCTGIFGGFGSAWPGGLDRPQPYAGEADLLRRLMAALAGEITLMEQVTGGLPAGHDGCRAIQGLPGAGPVPAAVIVAEIGGIRRFPGPGQLASRAGLTPRHREPGVKAARGHVTKQGSPTLRRAVVEAVQRQPAGPRPRQVKDAVIARRGKEAKNTAEVAAARGLPCDVFCAMRDGRARRAPGPGQAA